MRQINHNTVFIVGSDTDNNRLFHALNAFESDVIVEQISSLFEGREMNNDIVKFLRWLDMTQCIVSEVSLDEINEDTWLTTIARWGMVDIPTTISVKMLVDAYKGSPDSCASTEDYRKTFCNIIENLGIKYNPNTLETANTDEAIVSA